MKFEHVPHGQIDLLRLCWSAPATVSAISPGTEAFLQFSEREALSLLKIGSEVYPVQGDGRKNATVLAELQTRHSARLVCVVDANPKTITVRVHTFFHELVLSGLDIGVDDKIVESIKGIDRNVGTPQQVLQWLQDQFFVEGEDCIRAFMTAGSEAFVLHGRSMRAFARQEEGADKVQRVFLDKLVRGKSQGAELVVLVAGNVRFVDATKAEQFRVEAVAALASLVASGSGFVEIWRKYGALEQESSLRQARQAGWLEYTHVESLPNNQFRFSLKHLDGSSNAVAAFKRALDSEQGASIEVDVTVPDVLLQEEMTWAEFESIKRERAPCFEGKLIYHRRDHALTLTRRRDEELRPPEQGVLYKSLRGDETQFKRRENAQLALLQPQRAMHLRLRQFLEGQPVPKGRRGTLPALSPSVKRKVFGDRSPTATQEKALHVALNTPDIALIQGPPGTGKTTIITALVERLQEIWDAADGLQGRLLLSGFQHDAVENAMQRMRPNGLPPIKFGNELRMDEMIDKWSTERVAALRAQLPARPISILRDELSTVIQAYVLAPGTLEQTGEMLARVAQRLQSQSNVSAALTKQMVVLSHDLFERVRTSRQGDPDLERLIRRVRALRCDAAPFADDGPRNAYLLFRALLRRESVDAATQTLLDAATNWDQPNPPPFLDELRALRRRLLLQLIPADRMEDTVPRVRTDVLEVLSAVRDDLDKQYRGTLDATDDAVHSFLTVLESDPDAVKRAVISYTSVFAATCQQSAQKDLALLKGSKEYDTVVIDEAARANPLDLFIPLVQATGRIVLVGDHRQLPHMLDQKLERELEEALAVDKTAEHRTRELLDESLFERLFKELQAREAKDGIPRVVTLDEQYRMHPKLGKFVSDEFYAKNDPREAFRSPRPEAEFAHDLPGYVGPAVWIDVPRRDGGEVPDKSKSRPAEAKIIVSELQRLMTSKEGQQLTFGVITFYREQVRLIARELVNASMAMETEDDSVEIEEPYREVVLPNGRRVERLRFGTVDAFQGMEFDVVFLSMVRCNVLPAATPKDYRRRFGHLMSPNRLCVAMSRQKKLLVMVGDGAMLEGRAALEAIGPLVAFKKMSEVWHVAKV